MKQKQHKKVYKVLLKHIDFQNVSNFDAETKIQCINNYL